MARIEKNRNACRNLGVKYECKRPLQDVGVDGRIIIK